MSNKFEELINNVINKKSNNGRSYNKFRKKLIKTAALLYLASKLSGCTDDQMEIPATDTGNAIPVETIENAPNTNISASMILEYADMLATDLAKEKHKDATAAKFKALLPNSTEKYVTPIEYIIPEYTDHTVPIRDICLFSVVAEVTTPEGVFEEKFSNVAINTSVVNDLMSSIGISPTILTEELAKSLESYNPNDLNYTIYLFDQISREEMINHEHAAESIYNTLLSAYGINVWGEDIHKGFEIEFGN